MDIIGDYVPADVGGAVAVDILTALDGIGGMAPETFQIT